MRQGIIVVLAILVGGQGALAADLVMRSDRPVPGRYLVVFGGDTEPGTLASSQGRRHSSVLAQELAVLHGGKVRQTFTHALQGAVLELAEAAAQDLARHPEVALVEEDGYVGLAGSQANPPSWGLDRVDQRAVPLDGMYSYNTSGSGVVVYVVDTGIRSTHAEFAGRIDTANSFTTVDDGRGAEDCNGHGTMVAGIIAGTSFGVAKGATLRAVRVLDCQGVGTVSDVVAGLDWVTAKQTPAPKVKGKTQPPPPPPAVINLSLRIPGSAAVDIAVQNALAVGVSVVAAAGNDGGDACGFSPGRLPGVLTIGASNDADNVWVYSNGGPCVKLFAPGVGVATTTAASDTGWGYLTGTSAAAPHVAGTAALYLAGAPQTKPADLLDHLLTDATAGALALVPLQSPNRLLYTALAGLDRPPVARFTYSCRSGRCTFDASGSSDDFGIAGYAWNFGDGSNGSGATVTHRFPTGSAFLVTLTVTDTAGQTASTSQVVSP